MSIHPCGIVHLLDLFPSRDRAYQVLAKMRKKGQLNFVGYVQIKGHGRPRDVFCDWVPNYLKHEYFLTDFCLAYEDADWIRGKHVDQDMLPDAEMYLGENRFLVELDRGTIRSWKKMEVRFQKYEDCEDTVLWVCLGEDRMRGLMEHAGSIADVSWFTTLEKVIDDPWGDVWTNCAGQITGLERPSEI